MKKTIILLLVVLSLFSCRGGPSSRSNRMSSTDLSGMQDGRLVEEILGVTERGTPSSLLRALEIINQNNLQSTEFGRVMTAVNVSLFNALYPSIHAQLPPLDLPLTHSYSRILRNVEQGIYTNPDLEHSSYIEYILPFLAYYQRTVPENQLITAVPDLERAMEINPDSVIARYFLGIVYERTGRTEEALSVFSEAWDMFPDSYPVALGLSRVLDTMGRSAETVDILQNLVVEMPDNIQVKRQLALAYYNTQDWSRAENAVAEILQTNSRDADFVLMRAHILVEQGRLMQAQTPLDLYASINPNNRLYLYLRARIQAEAFQNRDSALNYLRSIIRSSPSPEIIDEVIIYTLQLFMDSPRLQDQAEGRDFLNSLLAGPNPPLELISLALEDAIRREAWNEARPYLNELLSGRRHPADLRAAYMVERETGNNEAALSFARELYDLDRDSDEGIIAFITALIDTGYQDEAADMIEERLGGMSSGPLRSRYLFLRSQVNEERMLNDLRSSLFDDPRNLDALVAMYEIYYRRRDERRAGYYLRQALALAPNDQRLRRFEAEFLNTYGQL